MMQGRKLAKMIIEAIDKTKSTEKKEMWESIAEAFVKFLQENADVIPITLIAPQNGGPVSGKGKLQ